MHPRHVILRAWRRLRASAILAWIAAPVSAAALIAAAPVPALAAHPATGAAAGTTTGTSLTVGVGSDTTETLFDQFAADINGRVPGAHLVNYWATGSSTIPLKPGCAPITRPDGTSPGIAALASRQTLPDGTPCIDFARSLAPRAPGAPADSVFLPFAGDGVTYAVNAQTHAPDSLTTAQLAAILECQVTSWDQVGGSTGQTIQPFLPDLGPGLALLLRELLGVDQIGACVQVTQQDQGTAPELKDNPNALVFYSIGKYLAQTEYHHADVHGSLVLGRIDDTTPTVFNPVTGRVEINAGQVPGVPGIPASLRINEYVVVRDGSDGLVPPALRQLFDGPGSWVCGSRQANADIQDYGFLPLPPAQCGQPQ